MSNLLTHRGRAVPARGHPVGRTRERRCGMERPSIGQSVQSKGEIPMDHLISYLVAVVVLYAVPTILCAPLLMYFSGGGLRFRQSLRIAALGFAIMLPAIKLTVEPVIAEEISLIAIPLCICGAGFLITQLAAREGVKKTGWLGVGAKSVLSAFALSQLSLSVLYVAGAFDGISL